MTSSDQPVHIFFGGTYEKAYLFQVRCGCPFSLSLGFFPSIRWRIAPANFGASKGFPCSLYVIARNVRTPGRDKVRHRLCREETKTPLPNLQKFALFGTPSSSILAQPVQRTSRNQKEQHSHVIKARKAANDAERRKSMPLLRRT